MENKGWYKLCEWIMRLAYVNLLWLIFILLGLIVFGFFPATASMFTIIRKWVRKEENFPVLKTFWETYRTEFIRVNLLGIIFVLIGLVLYFDIKYFQLQNGLLAFFLYCISAFVLLLFISALLFFFPVFVHFEMRLLQYLKYSFLIPFFRPLELIIMVGAVSVGYIILVKVPGLLPFYSGSLVSVVLMFYAIKAFEKIEQAKKNGLKFRRNIQYKEEIINEI